MLDLTRPAGESVDARAYSTMIILGSSKPMTQTANIAGVMGCTFDAKATSFQTVRLSPGKEA